MGGDEAGRRAERGGVVDTRVRKRSARKGVPSAAAAASTTRWWGAWARSWRWGANPLILIGVGRGPLRQATGAGAPTTTVSLTPATAHAGAWSGWRLCVSSRLWRWPRAPTMLFKGKRARQKRWPLLCPHHPRDSSRRAARWRAADVERETDWIRTPPDGRSRGEGRGSYVAGADISGRLMNDEQ